MQQNTLGFLEYVGSLVQGSLRLPRHFESEAGPGDGERGLVQAESRPTLTAVKREKFAKVKQSTSKLRWSFSLY